MNDAVQPFLQRAVAEANECRRFCFMSRAREFQVESFQRLHVVLDEAKRLKKEMVEGQDEDSANLLLSAEGLLLAVLSELQMWVALKDDRASEAWNHLIDAQDALRTSIQSHDSLTGLDDYSERLESYEVMLFPPQSFMSAGILIKESRCSICGADYGSCSHVKGRAYLGRICSRVITEADLKEVSIVDEPADKRCRIEAISAEGAHRDWLTWRPVATYSSDEPE